MHAGLPRGLRLVVVTCTLRTATSRFFESGDSNTRQHLRLVHRVASHRTEWRSLCGYDFLSYETQQEPRIVTCMWCLAGLPRRIRHDFVSYMFRKKE